MALLLHVYTLLHGMGEGMAYGFNRKRFLSNITVVIVVVFTFFSIIKVVYFELFSLYFLTFFLSNITVEYF